MTNETTEDKPSYLATKQERDTQEFAGTLSKIFQSREDEFKAALGKWQEDGFKSMSPEFFRRLIMTAASGNSSLLKCTRNSLYISALEIAQLQLEPNTTLQEAFLIPYYDKRTSTTLCQVQIGRNGWVKLAYRTGLVSGVNALPVFEGEEFIWQPHTSPEIIHNPDVEISPDAKLIAAYAWIDMIDGKRMYEVLREKDINRIKNNLRYPSEPWKKHPDRMACRSALKRLIRTRLPVNEFLADKRSLAKEEEESEIVISAFPSEAEPQSTAPQEAAERVQRRVNELKVGVLGVTIDSDTGEIIEPQGLGSFGRPDGAENPKPHDRPEGNTKEKLPVSEFWNKISKKNEFWGVNITRKDVNTALKMLHGDKTLGQLTNDDRHAFLASIEDTMRNQSKAKKENEDDNIAF